MATAADVCESVAGEALQPIPLLLYHSVSDDPAPGIASLSVSPDEFRQHMDALVESGRKALTVSDFVDQLRAGSAPERPVLITFDDGVADSLEIVAPELEVRKLPATIYLTTGYVGSPGVTRAPRPPGRMLASGQLAELELAGFEIGAHTQRHPGWTWSEATSAGRRSPAPGRRSSSTSVTRCGPSLTRTATSTRWCASTSGRPASTRPAPSGTRSPTPPTTAGRWRG